MNLYKVTFKNGNTVTMTGHCLQYCYLRTVDDTVDHYEIIT